VHVAEKPRARVARRRVMTRRGRCARVEVVDLDEFTGSAEGSVVVALVGAVDAVAAVGAARCACGSSVAGVVPEGWVTVGGSETTWGWRSVDSVLL